MNDAANPHVTIADLRATFTGAALRVEIECDGVAMGRGWIVAVVGKRCPSPTVLVSYDEDGTNEPPTEFLSVQCEAGNLVDRLGRSFNLVDEHPSARGVLYRFRLA